MFTKTILATVAAAVVSAGAMALSTSGAEAGYAHYQNGYYATKTISVPKTIYKTIYKTVLVGYDYYNCPIYKQVPYTVYETIYVQKYVKVFVPYAYDTYSYNSGYVSSY
jgi:hypothetical protein